MVDIVVGMNWLEAAWAYLIAALAGTCSATDFAVVESIEMCVRMAEHCSWKGSSAVAIEVGLRWTG